MLILVCTVMTGNNSQIWEQLQSVRTGLAFCTRLVAFTKIGKTCVADRGKVDFNISQRTETHPKGWLALSPKSGLEIGL